MDRASIDLPIGRSRLIPRALSFVLVTGVLLVVPAAHALTPTVEPTLAPARIEFRFDPAEGGTIATARVYPADATGTVRFKLDENYIGSPVELVDGTARSIPVNIPVQSSHQFSVEYSGDARYQAVTAVSHYDSRPEDQPPAATVSPAPAAPAAVVRPETLVRTGSESAWLAIGAAALIGVGLVLFRMGSSKPNPDG